MRRIDHEVVADSVVNKISLVTSLSTDPVTAVDLTKLSGVEVAVNSDPERWQSTEHCREALL